MLRLEDRVAPLPLLFARYIARSASRSSVSAVLGAGGDPDRGADEELTPAQLERAPRASRASAARRGPASPGSPSSSSRTANSSPPSRAIVSVGRRQSASRSATATSSRSPVRCPRLSLTVLKPSRSQKSTATGVSARWARATAWRRRSMNKRSVGEPGERVVKRLVNRLLDRPRVVRARGSRARRRTAASAGRARRTRAPAGASPRPGCRPRCRAPKPARPSPPSSRRRGSRGSASGDAIPLTASASTTPRSRIARPPSPAAIGSWRRSAEQLGLWRRPRRPGWCG